MNTSMRRHQWGFTLLELLISIAVFAILSAMAYSGLQSVMDAKRVTEVQEERLVELQTAFMLIGRDLEQTVSRPVRDGFGDEQPAMQGSPFGNVLLAFTKAGYTNFLNKPRSTLQRVAYRLEDDELKRLSWPMVDQDFDQEPVERVLVKDVKKVEFRYFDGSDQPKDQWPASLFEDVSLGALPQVVEVKFTLDDMGELRRLFRVPPGENGVPAGNSNNPS